MDNYESNRDSPQEDFPTDMNSLVYQEAMIRGALPSRVVLLNLGGVFKRIVEPNDVWVSEQYGTRRGRRRTRFRERARERAMSLFRQ